jgi:ABC-type multidrug transport system fused ATPase/permease subunit
VNFIGYIWRFGWPYMRRYWVKFLVGIFFAAIFGLSNGSLVWGTKTILERLSPNAAQHATPGAEGVGALQSATHALVDDWLPRVGRPIDANQVIGGILFLPFLVGLRGFSRFLSASFMAAGSERVVNDLRVNVLTKLHSLSIDYFNRSTIGDLLQRVNGDTAVLNRALSFGFMDAIKEPFTMIGIIIALCAIDWKLTIATMVLTPLCLLPVNALAARARSAASEGIRAQIAANSMLVEMLNGIRVVKALNLEEKQTERFRGYSRTLIGAAVRAVRAREQINPAVETIAMFGMGLLIIYVFFSERTTPDMVAFLSGMILFFVPLKKLASLHVLLHESKFGVDRLAQLLNEVPSVHEKPDARPVTQFTDAIRFHNVTFAYDATPVLEEVELEIPRGAKVGIAGHNGSGKSTMLNLLLRFYDPTDGAITIDGHDLRDIRVADLRNLIGLVSQEVVIFDASIAENIGCANPGATREHIEAASKAAGCHDFIMEMPEGYDTQVGERGIRLSGGQRQRVSIARAFVRDAPIIILDEATASLDARAEAEIQATVDRLEEHRTVICVAHRLSTLAAMDKIVVLAAGRVVEEGTFQQLLVSGGAFAAMARQQGLGPAVSEPADTEFAPIEA